MTNEQLTTTESNENKRWGGGGVLQTLGDDRGGPGNAEDNLV